MGPTPERSRWGSVVSCIALAALAGGVAYPVYVLAADAYQPLVIRLTAAVVLGILLVHIHTRVREDFYGEPQSRFDVARETRDREIKIDRRLHELRAEVLRSVKSRRYFDDVLWPRLLVLAERHGRTLKPPPTRWPAFRGPALSTIAKLISSIERKQ